MTIITYAPLYKTLTGQVTHLQYHLPTYIYKGAPLFRPSPRIRYHPIIPPSRRTPLNLPPTRLVPPTAPLLLILFDIPHLYPLRTRQNVFQQQQQLQQHRV